MKALSLVSDYRHAIRSASSGNPLRAPRGLTSVLVARAAFDIGPRFHSLYDLASVPRTDWPEFIIDVGLKKIMRRINAPEDREIVNDKLRFFRHCEANALPSIPILGAIDRTSEDPTLNGVDNSLWVEQMGSAPDRVFIKLIDGTWGIDAFIAERRGNDNWRFCERNGAAADLHAFCLERLKGRRGWIVQPLVRSHAQLHRIMSSHALGTIRAVTFIENGIVALPYAVLRIPVGKNRADNFSHGASGNLVAPITMETGIVGVARGSKRKDWPEMMDVDVHPDTQNRISGFALPFWSELKKLIVAAHKSLPNLATLGWDVAITDSGPLIVETNPTYDVDLLQVALRRGLKSELVNTRLLPALASKA
ncbi:hypothetical protein PA01_11690 [Azoarcus sp. PA01]|nr:hypothetical protein PA01_11690 [Azoarcus sp. PA01]